WSLPHFLPLCPGRDRIRTPNSSGPAWRSAPSARRAALSSCAVRRALPSSRAVLSLQAPQVGAAPAFDLVELGEGGLDIPTTLLQLGTADRDLVQQVAQLPDLAGFGVVHVEDVRGLPEGEAQPLASQDQPQPDPVTCVEAALVASPLGGEQPLVLVEANGAQAHRVLLGELADRPGPLGLAGGCRHSGFLAPLD